MSIVLDASARLAWVHGDERPPAIEAVSDTAVATGAEVAANCHLEVANTLTIAVRCKCVSARFQDVVLAERGAMDIPPAPSVLHDTLGTRSAASRSSTI